MFIAATITTGKSWYNPHVHQRTNEEAVLPHTQKHHSTPMHVIFKLQKNKDKEKVLKEVRKGGRNLTYRGARIRITFSPQKSCQQKKEIFKVLKEIKTPA